MAVSPDKQAPEAGITTRRPRR
uniref:Uncharacterized protein n=1 Tax=Arundo donax TaxID=35708 RepID=A0A0A9BDX7_ARUDO